VLRERRAGEVRVAGAMRVIVRFMTTGPELPGYPVLRLRGRQRHLHTLPCLLAAGLALGLSACGGGDDKSSAAKVGDCIDAQKKVVSCGSPDAKQKLVSDQDKPDAIACITIGDKPQTQVKVGSGTFCAEPK
jgi:hypothetical protein